MNVDFPLPLAPMIATSFPRGTRIEIPFRMGRRPYEKLTDSTSTRISSDTRGKWRKEEEHFNSFAQRARL